MKTLLIFTVVMILSGNVGAGIFDIFSYNKKQLETEMKGLINQNLKVEQKANEINSALANLKLKVGNIETKFDMKFEANVKAMAGLDKSLNMKIGDVAGSVNTTTNDPFIFYTIIVGLCGIIGILIRGNISTRGHLLDMIKSKTKYQGICLERDIEVKELIKKNGG